MRQHKNKWLNTHDDEALVLALRVEMGEGLNQFGPFASSHELYAVLKEELDEFWDSVKENDPDPNELLQICAVVYRGLVELCEQARQEILSANGCQ